MLAPAKQLTSKTLAVLAVFLMMPSLSHAETLAEAMEKCRLVNNSLKRLVCFDQLAQRANTLEDSDLQEFYANRPVVQPRPNAGEDDQTLPPRPVTKTQNTFGLETKIKRDEQEEQPELVAVVGKVETNGNYKLVITTEDGMVWTQTDTNKIKLRTGDEIIISRGMFSSFLLKKVGSKKSIRVRRNK